MAIIANLFIDQGTDFEVVVDVNDATGSVLNLTGYTSVAQIRKTYGSSNVSTSFTTNHGTASEGKITMSLTDTQTANFSPSLLKYDVLLTNPSGLKEYYLEGDIFMQEGYTA